MPSKKIEGVSRKDISILTDPELIRVAEGFNHRKEFDEEKLAQLAESIRLHGLKVPLTVRKDKGNDKQPFILIDGERRLRAVKKLYGEEMENPPVIPCIVEICDEDQAFITSAISNLERTDINAAEEAGIVQRFEKMGKSNKEIALICSRTTQWVSQRQTIAGGSKAIKNAIEEGDVPVDVALSVIRHVPAEEQAEVIEDALNAANGNKGNLRKEVAKKTKAKVRPKAREVEYIHTRLNQLNGSVRANERPVLRAMSMVLDYCNGETSEETLLTDAFELLKIKSDQLKKGA